MVMPSVVNVAAVASGTANITPALPTGLATNDILLMFGENQETTAGLPATPAGWNLVGTGSVTVTTGTITRLTAWWRRIAGGESAPTIVDPGDHMVARVMAVRGCKAIGNPWNQVTTGTETVSDTSVSIPGVTTTAPDCLVVAAFSTGIDTASGQVTGGTWANASLTSVTEQMNSWATAGLGGGLGVATGEKATPGVVSATTATVATAAQKSLLTIALEGANTVLPELPWLLHRSPRPVEQSQIAGPYAPPNPPTLLGG